MSRKIQAQHATKDTPAADKAAAPNHHAVLDIDQKTAANPSDLLLAFCRVYDRAERDLRDAWDRHNSQGAHIQQVWNAQDHVKLVLQAYECLSTKGPQPV
ncbi:hypothetical protein [Micavibrio aeruginosavorus]|uniref:Uncharacterized protein n=1 Tax=Micavibrio aeruginosavorus (strain ARL-13) TaxID=856793 RepID=G2KN49_MICAA|nr:hypothetical protein [Micavibrio aeruginosavorus]AEP09382.1 hypothetical protein MICA_1054 [Micavibrio aeruginosavorus ARL-13]